MVDIAYTKIKAGNGGDGIASFRREKYIPRGGPDGGDGGDGGSIYFVADQNMNTLLDIKSKKVWEAEAGGAGAGKNMFGKNGVDLTINVPVGTQIYKVDSDGQNPELLADLNTAGVTELIAKGGRGGKGNYRFKSSVNRTPLKFTRGGKGDEFFIKLEVKLIADIGIIGFPNAGKTTLINTLCNMSAKVANYPFTTLEPNLGVAILRDNSKVVLADIPGLIEGAALGKGLGHDFLRHVERTRLLLHVIDAYAPDNSDIVTFALQKYNDIRRELSEYNKDLLTKPELIVINKCDLPEVASALSDIKKTFKKMDIDVYGISAYTGEGIKELINALTEDLQKLPVSTAPTAKVVKKYNLENIPNRRILFNNKVEEDQE